MQVTIENINDLRLFASYYVEACDISFDDKVTFLKFVKEASGSQINHLLTEGKMVNDLKPLQEGDYDNLFKMFKEPTKTQKTATYAKHYAAKATPAIAVAAVIAAAAFAATKIYKNYLSKAAKACSTKKGDAKKICMNKFKLDAMKHRIVALNKGKGACKKSKDPKKCVKGIDNKISKLKGKIQARTA